jgi:hypothetical protein
LPLGPKRQAHCPRLDARRAALRRAPRGQLESGWVVRICRISPLSACVRTDDAAACSRHGTAITRRRRATSSPEVDPARARTTGDPGFRAGGSLWSNHATVPCSVNASGGLRRPPQLDVAKCDFKLATSTFGDGPKPSRCIRRQYQAHSPRFDLDSLKALGVRLCA